MKLKEQPPLGGDLGPYLFVEWDKEGYPGDVLFGGGLTLDTHIAEVIGRLEDLADLLQTELEDRANDRR